MDAAEHSQSLQELGPYRLTSLLGFNGVVATYKGFDQQTNQPASVVVCHQSHVVDESGWKSLEKELEPLVTARASRVAQPRHFGLDDQHYWTAYEWMQGSHLGVLVRDTGLPPQATAFEWTSQIIGALDILQDHGIVHRIINPASIFINTIQQAKLLHTGWGHLILNCQGGLLNPAFSSILPFTAPEVLSAREADVSADVYALGSNLYFLISGQPVFWHDDAGTLMEIIRNQEPDLSELREFLFPEAVDVLEEMLSRDPGDRPVNLPALSDRLMSVCRRLDEAAQREGSLGQQGGDTARVSQESAEFRPADFPRAPEAPQEHPSYPSGEYPSQVDAQTPAPSEGEFAGGQYAQPEYEQPQAGPPGSEGEQSRRLSEMIAAQRAKFSEPPAPPEPQEAEEGVQAPPKRSFLPLALIIAFGAVVLIGALATALLVFGGFLGGEEEVATVSEEPQAEAPSPQETYSKYAETVRRLRVLGQWNRAFYRQNGLWPREVEDLAELEADPANFQDAWEREIEVRNEFILSAGADGVWDNEDDTWFNAQEGSPGGYMPEPPSQ